MMVPSTPVARGPCLPLRYPVCLLEPIWAEFAPLHTDRLVGGLMGLLNDLALRQDTAVARFADHGDLRGRLHAQSRLWTPRLLTLEEMGNSV